MQKTYHKRNVNKKVSTKKDSAVGAKPLQIIVASLCIGIATMLTSSLALSFLMSKLPDPDILLMPCVLATSAICGISCGVCSATLSKKPMPYSLICGLFLVLIYLLISLIFDPADYNTDMVFKTANIAVLPLFSVFGGTVTSKKNKQKRM